MCSMQYVFIANASQNTSKLNVACRTLHGRYFGHENVKTSGSQTANAFIFCKEK